MFSIMNTISADAQAALLYSRPFLYPPFAQSALKISPRMGMKCMQFNWQAQ